MAVNRRIRDFATEYVWARITERNGQDISAETIVLAVKGVRDGSPLEDEWQPPDSNEAVSISVRRVAVLVGRDTPYSVKGQYNLWWRMTDTPEKPGELAGTFQIY